jgi:very-short-patch-repair endonuclease
MDEKGFVDEYVSSFIGLEPLCKKFHIGKLRGKEILIRNGVELRSKSSPRKEHAYIVPDWRIQKYPPKEGYHYEAVDRLTGFVTLDIKNRGGVLTEHIRKEYGVPNPSLYERREYYKTTGSYWWEQWFNVRLVKDVETKRCPYCEWTTIDLENKSGAFGVHLHNIHGITIEEHLREHPEDREYFNKYCISEEKAEKLKNPENRVVCPICKKPFERITESHVLTHGLTMINFRENYPGIPVMSKHNLDQVRKANKLGNLVVSKKRFISKYEREVREFVASRGLKFEANRQILGGKEIDLLFPERKIGIEFDGLKWHTEWFGRKPHDYHLGKTLLCNESGYGLIHIFEDEYVNSREIVLAKISHILGLDTEQVAVPARKCIVKPILKSVAQEFLNKNHIQGFVSSTVYLGALYEDELVAVMSFKKGNIKNPCWELTRFAGKIGYRLQGVGGKLFKYFTRNYGPDEVISFADRRWTISVKDNLYTHLGFTLDKVCPPDYKYYNERVDRYRRIHKMSFAKKTLSKKYGFSMSMTEKEMAQELGYDRIWDCGMFKYRWVCQK